MNIQKFVEQAEMKRHQEQAPGIDGVVGSWGNLERFAKLVAAHEREECAKLMFDIGSAKLANAIKERNKA